MPDYGTNKKLISKEVNYLGRDFTDIRANLIEFAKSYFPTQYNDFNEASPGMMFVEMASYVGDVLNYYVDNQFRETLLHYAEERKNVLAIAQSYGYKPKLATPSTVQLTVSVEVPAKVATGGSNYQADLIFQRVSQPYLYCLLWLSAPPMYILLDRGVDCQCHQLYW